MSIYLIAEAGINHDGDTNKAIELIVAAHWSGANAVKFQLYDADRVCNKNSDQYAWLKQCQLSVAQINALMWHASEYRLDFICTPDHYEDAQALAEMKVDKIKIGSGQAKDRPYLKKVAALGLPMIISTGMMTEAEVRASFYAVNHVKDLTFLHCTSAYPARADQLNLTAALEMRKQLPGAKIGYSSHCIEGATACGVSCVAMGLDVFEFHIDIDTKGPDAGSSLKLEAAREMILQMRYAEQMKGDGVKRFMPSEIATKALLDARRL